MNVTPKTHATLVRKAAARKQAVTPDARRLAYSSNTGDAPKAPEAPKARWAEPVDEAHCFVCGRHTDHWGEHDDLVEQGKARYEDDGSVYPV